jgi:hypothetical protein
MHGILLSTQILWSRRRDSGNRGGCRLADVGLLGVQQGSQVG